jgi:hypothetical protein
VFARFDSDDAIQSLQEVETVYHVKGKKNSEACRVQLQESEVEKTLVSSWTIARQTQTQSSS